MFLIFLILKDEIFIKQIKNISKIVSNGFNMNASLFSTESLKHAEIVKERTFDEDNIKQKFPSNFTKFPRRKGEKGKKKTRK